MGASKPVNDPTVRYIPRRQGGGFYSIETPKGQQECRQKRAGQADERQPRSVALRDDVMTRGDCDR